MTTVITITYLESLRSLDFLLRLRDLDLDLDLDRDLLR